jgi:rhodanese-related sulfurtransferase
MDGTGLSRLLRGSLTRIVAHLALVLVAVAASGCTRTAPVDTATRYVTQYGLGPDKWATAWLLTRQADPTSELVVTQPGAALPDGVSFDIPSSQIKRLGNRSAFEVARERFALRDPVIATLASIVHEIEVNFWAPGNGSPEARLIEDAYRSLQYRYGRDTVTSQCYVAFFDRVYQVLKDAQTNSVPMTPERLQLSCNELTQLAAHDRNLIPEVPLIDVLSAQAAGRKVVFVDVREADEYAEGHIPGALNIPIRDVSPSLRERLGGADYVVSYCIKDFRGYEMAKALAQIGVENSVIMRPYGIKGWVAMGLPVTGDKALSETQGAEQLERCLADTGACVSAAKGTT